MSTIKSVSTAGSKVEISRVPCVSRAFYDQETVLLDVTREPMGDPCDSLVNSAPGQNKVQLNPPRHGCIIGRS